MDLERLTRRLCKWLFLRLEDDMNMRKVYREDNFVDEMQIISTYRNIYVEAVIEHEIRNLRIICGKENLTEADIKINEKAIAEGKEPPKKRGEKPYTLIGLVDDKYEGNDLTRENIQVRLYHFFANLKKFYKMFPKETKPAILSINVIGETEEDIDEYTQHTVIHYLSHTEPIIPFLLDFGKYVDHENEAKRKVEELEEQADIRPSYEDPAADTEDKE